MTDSRSTLKLRSRPTSTYSPKARTSRMLRVHGQQPKAGEEWISSPQIEIKFSYIASEAPTPKHLHYQSRGKLSDNKLSL